MPIKAAVKGADRPHHPSLANAPTNVMASI